MPIRGGRLVIIKSCNCALGWQRCLLTPARPAASQAGAALPPGSHRFPRGFSVEQEECTRSEEGAAFAFHCSAGLSCVLCLSHHLCPWEEAHTSTWLHPSAAFELKNKNDAAKQQPYAKMKCAGWGEHPAATARVPGDCKCKVKPILVLLLHSLAANALVWW